MKPPRKERRLRALPSRAGPGYRPRSFGGDHPGRGAAREALRKARLAPVDGQGVLPLTATTRPANQHRFRCGSHSLASFPPFSWRFTLGLAGGGPCP